MARNITPEEATRVFRIDAPGADDVRLGILSRAGSSESADFPPVLLVHGATFGAALFDLPVAGYSLLEELARKGRNVYALDIRGYGHSLSGRVMNSPAEAHPPFARLADAVTDIGAAVRFVLDREQTKALDLVGFSWGTVACARYAGDAPEHVARLALYAPLYAELNQMWLMRIGAPDDRTRIDPKFGAYRMITAAEVIQRWDDDISGCDPHIYREEGLPEAIFEALAALDPLARSHQPAAFRSPTGALADLIRVFNGRPLYDPAKVTMPVLLIRGADDSTSTDTDSKRLLSDIGSSKKEYRVIARGSHFLCVEKSRTGLYNCLNDFLISNGERKKQGTT